MADFHASESVMNYLTEICRMLYQQYCEDHNIPDEEASTSVKISDYVKWVRKEDLFNNHTITQSLENIGFPKEVIDIARDIVFGGSDFDACKTLYPYWTLISTACWDDPEHHIRQAYVSISLRRDDEIQISIPVVIDFTADDKSDGFVLHVLEAGFKDLIHLCKKQGLNALFEKFGKPAPSLTDEETKKLKAELAKQHFDTTYGAKNTDSPQDN